MGQITRQGTLAVGSNLLFTAPANKSYISSLLMFNNPSTPYDIEIQRHDASESNTTTLCTLTLDAGDTVFDTTPYPLNQQDQLIVVSSTVGTTYLATFVELNYQV